MAIHYYGIRHHGPGCARALQAALAGQQPDIVLLEGPPEADALIALAADPAMQPPVALLVYPSEAPQHGVFYPFAEFSPEWRAIRHALEQQIPLWFIDLSPTHGFAETLAAEAVPQPEESSASVDEAVAVPDADEATDAQPAAARIDPIAELSRAAGYQDPELWWELQIEQRADAHALFAAIAEAMHAVREQAPSPDLREQRREAHMRQRIRAAEKAGYQNIAVICGAWHLPALQQPFTLKHDQALLKGLPKTKVAATWVPWSDDRLALASGYGAGVSSPGWYRHLWESEERSGIRWMTEAARLMREQGLDISSASVIEAVRLAQALAALRAQAHPGLLEQREAMQTVLCHGETGALELIRRKLEIGSRLGSVPASAEAAPLQRDLENQQKRLRLKPSIEAKRQDLDLREELGRERSCLLHRLQIIGVPWGQLLRNGNHTGTFRESWELRWQADFSVDLIAASRYGNTIDSAASQMLCERARRAVALPELTEMLDQAMLGQLPVASTVLLGCVHSQAALASDLAHLMEALPPLARLARYGDVRATATSSVQPIVTGLVERICVGLLPAASQLDQDAAERLIGRMEAVQQALDTLDQADLRADWFASLSQLIGAAGVAAMVRGFALRLAFDRQQIDADTLGQQARLALAAAVPAAESTAWLTGLLRGSGLLLLQHDSLWRTIDGWLQGLDSALFLERLPLLRRAFADFSTAERRQMGDKVRRLEAASSAATAPQQIDHHRAQRVLPVLASILGG
ncbi:DUF5682 family protein [Chitinimonas taiwanensis]|uniref:DUF5682 family protein n=1 Tax=Chitinimonas taiwanensis TaxID=240412 RepID=UPI0035B150B7